MDISVLSEKEFNEISRRFSELDENKDGEISRKELVDAFQEKKQDIPEKDIEYMFKILDKNQNGTIVHQLEQVQVNNWDCCKLLSYQP